MEVHTCKGGYEICRCANLYIRKTLKIELCIYVSMCLCVCIFLSTYPCISVSTRLRINVFFVSTHPCTNESVHGSMNLAANRSIRQSPGHIYITIWRNEKIQEH